MQKLSKLFFLCAFLGMGFGSYFLNNSISNPKDQNLAIAKSQISSSKKKPNSNINPNTVTEESEYQRLMQILGDRQLSKLPFNEVIQTISTQFIGGNYRESLLDQEETEKLFVSLTEFDCVLFVETVLAFSKNFLAANPSYGKFVQNVEEVRYVDGKLDGYCSRLHYFSEWIRDNQRKNIVQDITANLGGIPLKKTLNFMSSNWQKYPRLKNSETNYQCILAMEKKIAEEMRSQPLQYIPSNQIRRIYPSLKAGDIIAVVTDIKGLDTTHTGLVYPTAKDTSFIHASPSGKVKVTKDLQGYVERVDHAIGIMVARPVSSSNI
jgi:hypothetical protein